MGLKRKRGKSKGGKKNTKSNPEHCPELQSLRQTFESREGGVRCREKRTKRLSGDGNKRFTVDPERGSGRG